MTILLISRIMIEIWTRWTFDDKSIFMLVGYTLNNWISNKAFRAFRLFSASQIIKFFFSENMAALGTYTFPSFFPAS